MYIISVYLFSIDILIFSKKICIGYFYTVNFLYHTSEYIFKFINLWNKNYLLPFTCFTNKKKYNICIHYTYIQHTVKGISKTKIITYIQLHPLETMQYMYANWHNFAHNHIQTPCLIQLFTKLPSNVIIDKFGITKKHSYQNYDFFCPGPNE
jgi:hypothetical protein